VAILRRKRCADCRAPLSAGSSSDRCGGCQELYAAELAGLQGEHVPPGAYSEAGAVVDYSRGGFSAPGMAPPVAYRPNPRHDSVQRARLDQQQNSGDGEADQMTWNSSLEAVRASGRFVNFPTPDMTPAPDPLGRSVPRDRGLYGRDGSPGQLLSAAAGGVQYVRAPAAPAQMQVRKQGKRFGDNVREPIQVVSGHLVAPPQSMLNAEARVTQQDRSEADHLRDLLPGRRR
jgi:hypothetical protein